MEDAESVAEVQLKHDFENEGIENGSRKHCCWKREVHTGNMICCTCCGSGVKGSSIVYFLLYYSLFGIIMAALVGISAVIYIYIPEHVAGTDPFFYMSTPKIEEKHNNKITFQSVVCKKLNKKGAGDIDVEFTVEKAGQSVVFTLELSTQPPVVMSPVSSTATTFNFKLSTLGDYKAVLKKGGTEVVTSSDFELIDDPAEKECS